MMEALEVCYSQVDGKSNESDGDGIDKHSGQPIHCSGKAVFTDTQGAGIFGMGFLLATAGNLNFQNKKWALSADYINCTDGAGEPFAGRVLVAETIKVPSGGESLVPGVVDGKY